MRLINLQADARVWETAFQSAHAIRRLGWHGRCLCMLPASAGPKACKQRHLRPGWLQQSTHKISILLANACVHQLAGTLPCMPVPSRILQHEQSMRYIADIGMPPGAS